MEELYDFAARGGILMIPILASSVLALGIFIERLWALQRQKVLPAAFMGHLERLVREGKVSEAEALAASGESSVALVMQAGLRYRGRRREVIKESLEEAGRQEVALLERFVGALGTIANVAPLMGLLGTVAGMIQAFQQVVDEVAKVATVDPGTLASGIWAALITTAAGLTVAIPAFLAYKYLLSRIDRYAMEMEEYSLQMVDYLEADEGRVSSARDGANAAEATAEPAAAEGAGS